MTAVVAASSGPVSSSSASAKPMATLHEGADRLTHRRLCPGGQGANPVPHRAPGGGVALLGIEERYGRAQLGGPCVGRCGDESVPGVDLRIDLQIDRVDLERARELLDRSKSRRHRAPLEPRQASTQTELDDRLERQAVRGAQLPESAREEVRQRRLRRSLRNLLRGPFGAFRFAHCGGRRDSHRGPPQARDARVLRSRVVALVQVGAKERLAAEQLHLPHASVDRAREDLDPLAGTEPTLSTFDCGVPFPVAERAGERADGVDDHAQVRRPSEGGASRLAQRAGGAKDPKSSARRNRSIRRAARHPLTGAPKHRLGGRGRRRGRS